MNGFTLFCINITYSNNKLAKSFSGAKHSKCFLSLHRADHLLTNPKFSRYAGNLIAQWSKIYI